MLCKSITPNRNLCTGSNPAATDHLRTRPILVFVYCTNSKNLNAIYCEIIELATGRYWMTLPNVYLICYQLSTLISFGSSDFRPTENQK